MTLPTWLYRLWTTLMRWCLLLISVGDLLSSLVVQWTVVSGPWTLRVTSVESCLSEPSASRLVRWAMMSMLLRKIRARLLLVSLKCMKCGTIGGDLGVSRSVSCLLCVLVC